MDWKIFQQNHNNFYPLKEAGLELVVDLTLFLSRMSNSILQFMKASAGTYLLAFKSWNNLRALSTLRGLRGAPEVPPLCRETQSLGQQMLNAPQYM